MKKKDILQYIKNELHRSLDISLKDIDDVVSLYFECFLEQAVVHGRNFKTPIGTLFTKKLKPRKGKTPKGKDFSIGERTKISFRQNKRAENWIRDELNVVF